MPVRHKKARLLVAIAVFVAMAGCGDAPGQESPKPPIGETSAGIPPVDAAAAREMLAAGALVIDVREPWELRETGSLEGAANLPMSSFAKQARGLPRDRPIIIYCRSGRRSAIAGDILRSLEFDDVHNLGGFDAAADAGWPVERG